MAEIPELTDDQWAELTERLTLYASCKLVRRYWRGLRVKRSESVTKGHEAGDLAADAIVAVLEGKRESWNREAYPDFYRFLQSVVDSKISALVRSAENRQTRRLEQPHEGAPPAEAYTVKSNSPRPDQLVEDAEWKEKFRSALAKAMADDTLSLALFDCLYAGVNDRSEIAQYLDVNVNDVYNAQKRLQRRVEAVMKKFDQGKKS